MKRLVPASALTAADAVRDLSDPTFSDAVIRWQKEHGRHALPWQNTRDAYRIWLSEIMLQQTQVTAVIPYYQRFLVRFPDVEALAAAPSEDVMSHWSGLGYYTRARNLHKCAQVVAHDYGGLFPDTVEGLLALPGIGPYTAAAIASIAFDLPAVAVDGNVERVVSRFFAIEEPLPLSKDAIRKGAAVIAGGVTRAGDFTQAFMELGATVCTPRKPKCPLCPWQADCKVRRNGNAEELPRKLAKAARPVRYGKVFWHESVYPMTGIPEEKIFDSERMLTLIKQEILDAAAQGDCVLVGRGAACALAGRRSTRRSRASRTTPRSSSRPRARSSRRGPGCSSTACRPCAPARRRG